MWQPVRTAKSASVTKSNGKSAARKLCTGDTYTFSAKVPEGDRDWTMHVVTSAFYDDNDEHTRGVLLSSVAKEKKGQLTASFKVRKRWDGQSVRLVFVGGQVDSKKQGAGLRALGSGKVYKIG